MTFNQEQTQAIEKLAGLNYTIKQIAMYLDIPYKDLQLQFEDKESEFRYRYDRGRLIAQADIDQKLLDSAQGGNLTAMQMFAKARALNHFENMRDLMINGD